MKIKPLIVLDVESTGLDKNKAHLLQLAMVKVDDLSKDNSSYEQLNLFVRHDLLTHVEPKAISMVASVLAKSTDENTVHLVELRNKVMEFLLKTLNDMKGEKFVLAGKNVATFDLEILRANGIQMPNVSHRIFDVGSLYFSDFGYMPSLGEINKKLGKPEVSHDALQDCYDVIDAIKAKCIKS
jgi:oligoribonuclease (3'-5' exoribonuclease)